MLLLTFFRLLRLKIAFSEHSARAEATRTERDFATPAEKLRSFSLSIRAILQATK